MTQSHKPNKSMLVYGIANRCSDLSRISTKDLETLFTYRELKNMSDQFETLYYKIKSGLLSARIK